MHLGLDSPRNTPRRLTFNSPYLGFFLASVCFFGGGLVHNYSLSIPLTWDFSLHHPYLIMKSKLVENFQFPLLGIFPCISCLCRIYGLVDVRLSIPLTWDFSLHLLEEQVPDKYFLSAFNSPYLGFFLASLATETCSSSFSVSSFNSPYLGFFLASSFRLTECTFLCC